MKHFKADKPLSGDLRQSTTRNFQDQQSKPNPTKRGECISKNGIEENYLQRLRSEEGQVLVQFTPQMDSELKKFSEDAVQESSEV